MPSGKNQKLKLCYLSRIMLSKTDEEHHLTLPEIQQFLEEYDVTADRKALYRDMEALSTLGIDVIGAKNGRGYDYYVGSKTFDLAELKLLVDSIQCSRFITEKKSKDLIEKLGSLASDYEAEQLKRQVVVKGRAKTMNETIYYNVDEIYRAISSNKQITFEYLRWTSKKKLEKRKEENYLVSPWALTWADENYYLIAFDEKIGKIRHYRVDKMKNIGITDAKRVGRTDFREFNVADYVRMNFDMYGGEQTRVQIECTEEMIGVFFDRFGTGIPVKEAKKSGWVETEIEVLVSTHFLTWILSLGEGVRITGPKAVTNQMKDFIGKAGEMYK